MIIEEVIIGKTIEWESTSQGTTTRKEGEILAIIYSDIDARDSLPNNIKGSRCKFDIKNPNISKCDRLLVKVMGGAKGNLDYYYTPRISVVNYLK